MQPAAAPSAWISRFAGDVRRGGPVLDVACGRGRHTRLFLERGHPVTAVDIDVSGLADLAGEDRLHVLACDLEDGRPFPLAGRTFAAVVVVAYLHRPLLPALVAAVAPGGLLLYETFSRDHTRFGRPTDPNFLLRAGELLDAVAGQLRVRAYEDVVVGTDDRRVALQRICAERAPQEQRA